MNIQPVGGIGRRYGNSFGLSNLNVSPLGNVHGSFPLPEDITGLKTFVGKSKISVYWNNVSNLFYRIDYYNNSSIPQGTPITVDPVRSPFYIKNMELDVVYYFTLKAYSYSGDSPVESFEISTTLPLAVGSNLILSLPVIYNDRTDIEIVDRYDIAKFLPLIDDRSDWLSSKFYQDFRELVPVGEYLVSGQANRPYNISYEIYGDTQYWFLLCYFNDIVDPTDIPAGTVLQYFSLTDLEALYFQGKGVTHSILK